MKYLFTVGAIILFCVAGNNPDAKGIGDLTMMFTALVVGILYLAKLEKK